MSYIRPGWDLKWVEGISKDYVYPTEDKGKIIIEDYGGISDEGIVELLIQEWDTHDILFKQHLIKRLADRLGVELRKKPLDWKIMVTRMDKRSNELVKKIHSKKFKKLSKSGRRKFIKGLTNE